MVIDTLRADHLPFYGYPLRTAPNLARLAEEGVLFRRAHSTSSYTAPATASILTSLRPSRHGVLVGLWAAAQEQREVDRIADRVETMAEAFAAAGYTTFAVTDNVNVSRAAGFDQGFHYFRNLRDRGAEAVNRQVLAWRQELGAAEPWFLYLHYMDPHKPYRRREPWYASYRPGGGDWRVAAYDSEIAFVDARIGELRRELGWDERTLVVVTSDHGEELMDRTRMGHGQTLYAEVLDVPLVLWGPPGWAGRREDARVSTLDILPTLVELLGLRQSPDHEGRSLLAPGERPPALAHVRKPVPDRSRELRALIRGDWKLVLHDTGERELYDLAADPGERSNAAEREPERGAAMRREIEALGAGPAEAARTRVEITPELAEHLRSLGYGE